MSLRDLPGDHLARFATSRCLGPLERVCLPHHAIICRRLPKTAGSAPARPIGAPFRLGRYFAPIRVSHPAGGIGFDGPRPGVLSGARQERDMSNPYEDVRGEDFARIAKGFDFQSPHLGKVDFPDQFVADYVAQIVRGESQDESEIDYSVARLGAQYEVIMYWGLLGPGYIYSINRILDESLYAEKGSIILPPGLYVFGECYGDRGIVYLTVNLDQGSGDYGKIFFWRKAHDALGTGDNTDPPAFAADTLGAYFAGLKTEAEAQAELVRLNRP
ncbi:hypothetical protein, partial [Rhodovulum sulfidophilum]|uniref:hypothetical protein n=1 Tax=Rhodovulum sulfidophilum TaxID=35806 RepID=UPI0019213563